MFEMVPLFIAVMAFACVAIVVFVVGRYVDSQASLNRRLPLAGATSQSTDLSRGFGSSFFLDSLAEKFDEKKFGIDGHLRTKLRRDLLRAGYFSDHAIRRYIFTRMALVLVLPTIIFILAEIFLSDIGFYTNIGIVALAALVAILGPDAYVARRGRLLQQEYRLVFPDLLDMLVVCTDAGLAWTRRLAEFNLRYQNKVLLWE